MKSRLSVVIAVSITPGATAFNRMPAPIHSGVTAFLRTHRASASLEAMYAALPYRSAAALRAAVSSPARISWTNSSGSDGVVVLEFELTATALALVPRSSSGRRPVKVATAP